MLGLLLAAVALTSPSAPTPSAGAVSAVERERLAPLAWLPDDPADSLYRAARKALSAGRNRDAAALFATIASRYPRSGYAADALYWQAFALYRIGGNDELRSARNVLHEQERRYPAAATHGDAATLATRVDAALARRGDANAAERITRDAADAAEPPEPPEAPETPETPEAPEVPSTSGGHRSLGAAPRPPRPPRPPRAPRAPRWGARGYERCDNEDDIQVAALNAVLQMDSERAVPLLRKVLARRDSASNCLRRKAVFLVSQKRTPETEDILLGAARTDPDLEVRSQAVFWLSQVGGERAVTALDSIVRLSKDPELQDKAIFALSQQSSPRAIAALRAYAERNDVSDEMRGKAIFWLSQQSSADASSFLRSLYGRIQNAELKENVLFAVSQRNDPANGKWLIDLARNGQEPLELRKKALFWAGQSGAPLGDLVSVYNTGADREIKEQVIFALSQRREKAALDQLITIARTEKDVELRKKALFWLGQSNDPRVADILGDILEGK
jgi:HEAT repeat protein